MLIVTQLLVENGIEINARDVYNAVPLKYAITIVKRPTEEIIEVYKYLLKNGSDYQVKDKFNKTCADYITEYSWRTGLLDLIGEK